MVTPHPSGKLDPSERRLLIGGALAVILMWVLVGLIVGIIGSVGTGSEMSVAVVSSHSATREKISMSWSPSRRTQVVRARMAALPPPETVRRVAAAARSAGMQT